MGHRKYLSLLFLAGWLLVLCQPVSELKGQVVKGCIKDLYSGHPLKQAHVRLQNTNGGVTSGSDGQFVLAVPLSGPVSLHISYVGYADSIFNITLAPGVELSRDFFLRPQAIHLDSVFITANRSLQHKDEVPARIETISRENIEKAPFNNTDELMLMVPGIHTDRDFGIFSRNAGVTMRGMNSTARVLVLVDGTPINKADGGGINWNRIAPEEIHRIEIVKGPASAIYGGNAMAGIINIITNKPDAPLKASVKAGVGSYNTQSLNTQVSGNHVEQGKGWYWNLSNMLRRGDGYLVNTPEETTPYDTTVFIKEVAADAMVGYAFNNKSNIEFSYSYWDDIRSDGVQVFENLGSYNKYSTQAYRMGFSHLAGQTQINITPYYHSESYFRQSESVGKKNNKYRLYDTQSQRDDYGLLTAFTRPAGQYLSITGGVDAKQGKVLSEEIYYTSTDYTIKTGQLNQYALYAVLQAELLQQKLLISGGARFDYIQFRNGSFGIQTPSALTAFIENYPVSFTDENWSALSPKLSAKYLFNDRLSSYVSYGVGYRPPMLDDMCTNRNITKGFKIANTQLAPEYLYNYEAGLNIQPLKNLWWEASFYHSEGRGFHYFVGTGDSVDTGGEEMKAVLIRDNIAQVKIYGVENALRYKPLKNLELSCNHTWNHSFIARFKNDKYENKNLEGKELMEVPAQMFNAALLYSIKFVSAMVSFHYTGAQWADDENTILTPAYDYFNIKITAEPRPYLVLGLGVQNLTNTIYVNNKGQLCPGRFILFDVMYRFQSKKS